MNEVISKLSDCGIVPVIKIDDAKKAIPLAQALLEGGINCAEITFRTNAAEEAISLIAKELPQMIVGAGTVLTTKQAGKAILAGAKFIVSPGFSPKVVEYCLEKSVPIVPGCITPTEITNALEYGLDVLKFFPAEQAGGLPMIKAMSPVFGSVSFMPTGGIGLNNLAEYLSFQKVVACGGSFMVSDDLLQVKELSKEARKIVLEVRGK